MSRPVLKRRPPRIDKERAVAMRLAGAKIKDIAAVFAASSSRVSQLLRGVKCPVNHRAKPRPYAERAIAMRRDGATHRQIADATGVHIDTISGFLASRPDVVCPVNHRARAAANAQAKRMTWLPAEYLDEYRRFSKLLGAADAKRLVLEQIERDNRKSEAA
jgi:transposase